MYLYRICMCRRVSVRACACSHVLEHPHVNSQRGCSGPRTLNQVRAFLCVPRVRRVYTKTSSHARALSLNLATSTHTTNTTHTCTPSLRRVLRLEGIEQGCGEAQIEGGGFSVFSGNATRLPTRVTPAIPSYLNTIMAVVSLLALTQIVGV
jgi:hypothetical protein